MTLKNYIILSLIGIASVVVFPLSVSAATIVSENMGVCFYDKSPTCLINDYSSIYVSKTDFGTFNVVGTVARGTHDDECQAHEDFDLYIDGKFYVTSTDPDPCEPGTTDIIKQEKYPSIILYPGPHTIHMVHGDHTNPLYPTAESVSVQLTFTSVPPVVVSCSMDANPVKINRGESAVLSWASSGAIFASIDQMIGSVPTTGSKTVSPLIDTIYTGTFTGPDFSIKKCSVKIDVMVPPTCSMNLNPTSIMSGGSSVLSWSSTNATSASINQNIGVVPVDGSASVSPLSATTYTGTFTGPGGTTTCSARLDVGTLPPPPTCSMDVNPASIINGESSSLSWSSTNVTSVSINQGIGDVSSTGSLDVSPSVDTTYTGTFTGPDGTVTCSAAVTVTSTPNGPTCSMSADPSSIVSGEDSTVSWSSTNVTSVSIDQGIGSVPVSGNSVVSPLVDTTYTGTFTGPEGTVTCSASVNVGGSSNEPYCTMGVGSSSLNPGQSTTLYWSSNNIDTTTIDQNIGLVNNNSSIVITPNGNTTYTGTFTGPNGTVNCSASVYFGGGGSNPPNVSLSKKTFEPELSFIYLSQIPYTGIPETLVYLFRIVFFGGLLYLYYRIDGRRWRVESK
ncbi:hypothetical protein KKC45_02850 [Patescibacteria group bacterium]|nr:hypothetical protein [Patescibacteria group bacterium]